MKGLFGPNIYISMAALILINLIPIFGVLNSGWNVGMVMGLYWIENLIIGLLNVPKIWMSKDGPKEGLFKSLFFLVHFGFFCFVHGVFIGSLFLEGQYPITLLGNTGLRLTLAGLFLSHLISFVVNFIGTREFEDRTAHEQMTQPYQRIMILHLVILGGGFLVDVLGQPVFALLLLVVIKIAIDLAAHRSEHKEAIRIED